MTAGTVDRALSLRGAARAVLECRDPELLIAGPAGTGCPGRNACGRCIRGLLCSRCNVGLGNFRDRPDLLLKAVEYLRG